MLVVGLFDLAEARINTDNFRLLTIPQLACAASSLYTREPLERSIKSQTNIYLFFTAPDIF